MNRYSSSILLPVLKKLLWVWLLGSFLPILGEEVIASEISGKTDEKTSLSIPRVAIQEGLLETSLGLSVPISLPSDSLPSDRLPTESEAKGGGDSVRGRTVSRLEKPKIKRLEKAPQRKSKERSVSGFSLGLEPWQVEKAMTETGEGNEILASVQTRMPETVASAVSAKIEVSESMPASESPESIGDSPRFLLGLDSLEISLENTSAKEMETPGEESESVDMSAEEFLPKLEEVSPSESMSVVTAAWTESVNTVSVIQVSYSEELDFLDIAPPQNHQEEPTSTQNTVSVEAVLPEMVEENVELLETVESQPEEDAGRVQISRTPSKLLISPMVMKNRMEQMRAQQEEVQEETVASSHSVSPEESEIAKEKEAKEKESLDLAEESLPELGEIEAEISPLEKVEPVIPDPVEEEKKKISRTVSVTPSEIVSEADVEAWVEQIAEKTVNRFSEALLDKAVDRAAQRILQQMEEKLAVKVEKMAAAKMASVIQERSFQMEKARNEDMAEEKDPRVSDSYSFEVTAIEQPATKKESFPVASAKASSIAVKKVSEKKILEETFSEVVLPELSELPELDEIQEPAVAEVEPAANIGSQASVKKETPGFIKISGRKKGNGDTADKKKTISEPMTMVEKLDEPDETAGFVRIGSKAKTPPIVTPHEPSKEMVKEMPPAKPQETFQDVRLTPCAGVVLNTESEVREVRMKERGICDTVEISSRQISLIGKQTGETILQIVFHDAAQPPMTLRVTVEGGNSEETRWIQWCVAAEKEIEEKTGAMVSIFLFQNRVFLKGVVSASSTTEVIAELLQKAFIQFQQENPANRQEEKMLLVNLLQTQN